MTSLLRTLAATRTVALLASLLFVLALVVRGAKPAAQVRPEDAVEDQARIAEPMQLVSRGAALRVAELDRWVSAERRQEFTAMRRAVFGLQGCPGTFDWLDGAEGQRFERCLGSLRTGHREDALAALTLLFQLARASEWKPGLRGRAQHAERLGGLLEDWLRVWGQRGAVDPLLAEPALACTLLYGRTMRSAWSAPLVGNNAAPYERARRFLAELVGDGGQRTDLGQALQSRHARALLPLAGERDVLSGFEEECEALFPSLAGDCGDG